MTGDKTQYFAAREAEACASALMSKGETFFTILRSNSYLKKITDMWMFYYGNYAHGDADNHRITFTGEQGELVRMPVNQFRNLARHIHGMITANRPILEAKAANTDYKSLAQTYLANGILDYYMREKGMEEVVYNAVEMAIVLGSSFVEMEWNAKAFQHCHVIH